MAAENTNTDSPIFVVPGRDHLVTQDWSEAEAAAAALPKAVVTVNGWWLADYADGMLIKWDRKLWRYAK
jgi:hypothetical protein